jgi:hypothetical protein
MPVFLANLPVWLLVVIGVILAYAGYRFWKHKKATAYKPNIATASPLDFSTPRDQPHSDG